MAENVVSNNDQVITEEESVKVHYEPKRTRRKKEGGTNPWFKVVVALLVLSILYSAF